MGIVIGWPLDRSAGAGAVIPAPGACFAGGLLFALRLGAGGTAFFAVDFFCGAGMRMPGMFICAAAGVPASAIAAALAASL
ncbi:MAG TPA: hypothetical protein VFW35_06785 [Sphingomicrobium sp.]|nr:hypothetical protein [Sphingomicrobium sp.]